MNLVTIYIISCNRPEFLKRAIQSCFEQTYENIEIIVVDDCSDIFDINDFSKLYSHQNIRFFRLPQKSGANIARNLAITKSNGFYVTGLDDDDYFHPKRIEFMFNSFQDKTDDISAISTRHMFESVEKKNSLKSRLKYIFKMFSILFGSGIKIHYHDLLNKNIVGNQIFTTKKNLVDIGMFDEQLPALQDYETWIRLSFIKGPILRINKFLYFKNDELVSITNKNRRKLKGFDYISTKHADIFKNREHCVELHKTLYQYKQISIKQFILFFKNGNRSYLIWLLLTFKVRAF